MATTGRAADATSDPDRVAARLREADFVQLVGRRDGAGLSAVGLLGTALDRLDTPYHLSLAASPAAGSHRVGDDGTTLGVGLDVGDVLVADDPIALAAYEVAAATGTDPDPILAIAGAVAGGAVPSGPAFTAAQERGVERRPGVGVPTADVGAGLAYATQIHTSFSGDEQAAGAFLAELGLPAELDENAQIRLASAVALEMSTAGSTAASDGLDGFLAPLESPTAFETVEGYADVLDALAFGEPGLGIAFVLGHEERESALDVWRSVGRAVHSAVTRVSLTATGSTSVGTVEAVDPRPVARLVAATRLEAGRVAIGGPSGVALATTGGNARDELATRFDERDVTGDDGLAMLHGDVEAAVVADQLEADA